MKRLVYLCSAIFLSCAVLAVVISHICWPIQIENRNPASDVDGFTAVAVRAFKALPFSDRFHDYMQATGIAKYGAGDSDSNQGLIDFNNTILKRNSCFAELTSRFTDEIKLIDYSRPIQDVRSQAAVHLSQSLNSLSQPKAGFLWDLALRYADNNPNLAMHLIGICGHDDVMGTHLTDRLSLPHYSDKKMAEKKDRMWARVSSLIENFDSKIPPDKWDDYRLSCTSYDDSDLENSFKNPSCPFRNSALYTPGALSEEAILPQSLISKIVKTQAPHDGAAALPAKAYHITGAAFATCLLYERGVPPIIASNLNKTATNAYRAKTICEKLSHEYDTGVELNKLPAISDADLAAYSKLNSQNASLCENNPSGKIKALCDLRNVSESTAESKLGLTSAIKLYARRADGAYLLGQTNAFKNAYKSNCNRVDFTSSLEHALEHISLGSCPKSWPSARCVGALGYVQSWLMDFEWTRAEQEVGERFAREHCQFIGNRDPVAHACEALRKIKTATIKQNSAPTSFKPTNSVD